MGDRAGYRCRKEDDISPMLRKQWFVGDTKEEIKIFVKAVAEVLMDERAKGYKIDSGIVALRNDLDISRLFAAMVHAIYSSPFDSVDKEISFDISDNGIFEIELKDWNEWIINNYEVEAIAIVEDDKRSFKEEVRDKHELLKVYFEAGKILEKGIHFE